MTTITFRTPKGATIEIGTQTEIASMYDANVMVPCHELRILANGKRLMGGYKLANVPGHGECLVPYIGGNPTIQVPETNLGEVRVFFSNYAAEVKARLDRDLAKGRGVDLTGTSFAQEHADEIKLNGGRR